MNNYLSLGVADAKQIDSIINQEEEAGNIPEVGNQVGLVEKRNGEDVFTLTVGAEGSWMVLVMPN